MCSIMGFTSKSLTAESVKEYFDRTVSRGPDMSRIEVMGDTCLCLPQAVDNGS